MLTTYSFLLPGMRCGNCKSRVEGLLQQFQDEKKLPIASYVVELVPEKKVTIEIRDADDSPTEVRRILAQLLHPYDPQLPTQVEKPNPLYKSRWILGALGLGSGLLFILLPSLMSLSLVGMLPLALSSVLLTILLGLGSYTSAWKKFKTERALTMDTLFSMSTLTVMIVSCFALVVPWLPRMFDVGLLIFGFRHMGLAIEESIKTSMGLKQKFTDRLPLKVERYRDDGSRELCSLNEVKPQDKLLIKPGAIIPVDGDTDTPEGIVVDTLLRGDTEPRVMKPNERLLSGMYLAANSPPIVLNVQLPAQCSYLARLDASITRAKEEKAPLETTTNKIMNFFIPTVIGVALISALIVGYFFSLSLAIQCAVSVLVSACPCTLGFITPLALNIGMYKANKNAVHFKSSKTLQEADQIDVVVFDLHGTLTEGLPSVKAVEVLLGAGLSRNELLGLVAQIESHSTHPVAHAIGSYIANQSIKSGTSPLTAIDTTKHFGVTACINNEILMVGNQTMMQQAGIVTQSLEAQLALDSTDTIIYVARQSDKHVLGYIILTDALRPHAASMVSALSALGKQVHLCTGTDRTTALRYANQLGIPKEQVRAECNGAIENGSCDKQNYIRSLKSQGYRVAMVGDAGNDALAIAASDFAVAIQSQNGDEMTQQEAGALVRSGSLLPVVSAFAVAKQTVANIKQSLFVSLAYNVAAMTVSGGLLLTIGLSINPGFCVLLMIAQTTLILLNAWRFKEQKLEHTRQAESVQSPRRNSYDVIQSSVPPLQARPPLDQTLTKHTVTSSDVTIDRFGNSRDLTNGEVCLAMNGHADVSGVFDSMRFANPNG